MANFPFPLGTGHSYILRMPLNIIFPQPDSAATAQSYERHKLQPAGIPLRFPIAIQGGIWPFHFEVTTGPAGMTIGADLPTDWATNGTQGYGVLQWDNPTVGNHSIVVKVTDQGSNIKTISWTLSVVSKDDLTKFMWFDSVNGNNSTGTGSWTNPWKDDLRKAFGTLGNEATIQGHVILKAGTYTLVPHTGGIDAGTGIYFDNTKRPVVMYGMPTTALSVTKPTVNFTNSNMAYGNQSGFYIGDFIANDGNAAALNFSSFLFSNSQNRLTAFNVNVTNPQNGTAHNDNNTFLAFPAKAGDPTGFNQYVCIWNVTETGRTQGVNTAAICDMYGVEDVLIFNCHVLSSYANNAFSPKSSCKNFTIAMCDYFGQLGGDGFSIDLLGFTNDSVTNNNIEVVYHRGGSTSPANRTYRANGFNDTGMTNISTARCTWYGQYQIRNPIGGYCVSENDVIQSSAVPILDLQSGATISASGQECQGASGIINTSDLTLTGAYRTGYLGTRGFEITASTVTQSVARSYRRRRIMR